MKTQKTLYQTLKAFGIGALVTGLYFSLIATAVYENSKFRDIGEGFSVRERGKRREFYTGTNYGLARLVVDKDENGTLDETQQNTPISPYMGGPGYILLKTKTTEGDREKFARANYLYSLNKGEKNEN